MRRAQSSRTAVVTPWAVATIAAILFLAGPLLPGVVSDAAAADVSFGFFYSNLSPYGSWSVSADYGQVWRPYEYGPGWNPYYDGHWVYTDLGWTWVSDYPWGAVPYHYGTWAVDPVFGWVWVPGYVWAPSWVVFTSGPDYIGWAPVPPRYVVGGAVSIGSVGYDRFVIVPAHAFLAPRVRVHVVGGPAARNAISRTHIVNNLTVRNNIVVNRGPDPRGIERATRKNVQPVPIRGVERVTPGGRFDANEVRADRHGGGPPRVTSPEPVRPTRVAKQAPAAPPRAPSRSPAPPAPSNARPSAPPPPPHIAQPAPGRPATPAKPPQRPPSQGHAKPQKPPAGHEGHGDGQAGDHGGPASGHGPAGGHGHAGGHGGANKGRG